MKISYIGIQVFLTAFFISLFSLIIVSWYASDLGRNIYLEKTVESLTNEAKLISLLIDDPLFNAPSGKLQSLVKEIADEISIRITVILADGLVLADSERDPNLMDNHLSRPEVMMSEKAGVGSSIRFSDTVKRELMYVSILENREKGKVFIRVSKTLSVIEETISTIQQNIFFVGLVMLFASILGGYYMSRKISSPLEKILDGVRSFEKGNFSQKIRKPKGYEMQHLVESLNNMADQIDDKIITITRQEREQNAVLESMAEGVIAIDVDANILRMNKTSLKLFEVDKNSGYKGLYIREIINNVQIENLFLSVLKNGSPIDEEIKLRSQQEHLLKVSVRVLKDDDNYIIGALMVLNDLTRLRNLEEGRREFVANVSHELRTPLTSIQGFAEALNDGALDDKKNARKFVNIIYRQAARLGNILEDILTLSRLDRGSDLTDIEFIPMGINDIIQSAIELSLYNADKKHIQLENICGQDYLLSINQPLIEEALINLIDNAIKYSPENSTVTISSHVNKKKLIIEIKDQGPGIEKEHLPRLFERFYRVDKARSRNMGGTGLGLAIVKHIAQIHSGEIRVISEMGFGSTFSLHLPLLKETK